MNFSVVIPSYHGISLLKRNLPTVLKLGAKEVIVVDDCSPENDSDFLHQHFPQVTTFRNPKNLGFGSTVNNGVAKATGEIILLLNLDAKPHTAILPILTQDFQDPNVFAVSLAEQEFGPTAMTFKNGYLAHQPITPVPDHTVPTFWVSGGSGAFRKTMWDQLGGLDPIYDPFYWEDIDICHRATLQGWQNLWNPQARVEHHHESTIGKHVNQTYKRRIQERNHLIFTWKFLSLAQWPTHFIHLTKRLLRHPGYARIAYMALTRLVIRKSR